MMQKGISLLSKSITVGVSDFTFQGGFGFVFTGTYDARPNSAASRRDLKVVVKLPTTDPDAIKTFEGEMAINKKLSTFGRLPGVAEFVGTVDLRPIERQLPSGLGSRTGLVWIAVQGKTLDTFFDRGGGMSPVLASTLGVRESPPTRTAQGEVVYIKVCARFATAGQFNTLIMSCVVLGRLNCAGECLENHFCRFMSFMRKESFTAI